VEHALQQGPANAGPLGSHRLAPRTSGLMQDLSPAYLHHFMSHLDTMLQLDTMTLPQAAKPAKGGKRRLKSDARKRRALNRIPYDSLPPSNASTPPPNGRTRWCTTALPIL